MADRPDPKPYTRAQAIAALRRLEDRWPEGLALFAWSSTLHLIEREGLWADNMGPHTIASFPTIPCSGGDPQW